MSPSKFLDIKAKKIEYDLKLYDNNGKVTDLNQYEVQFENTKGNNERIFFEEKIQIKPANFNFKCSLLAGASDLRGRVANGRHPEWSGYRIGEIGAELIICNSVWIFSIYSLFFPRQWDILIILIWVLKGLVTISTLTRIIFIGNLISGTILILIL